MQLHEQARTLRRSQFHMPLRVTLHYAQPQSALHAGQAEVLPSGRQAAPRLGSGSASLVGNAQKKSGDANHPRIATNVSLHGSACLLGLAQNAFSQ